MITKIKVEKEVDVRFLSLCADVRYWEDAVVNGVEDENGGLIPCRDGDKWLLNIDVDRGQILNWTNGTTASVYYKVCDGCSWMLVDKNGDVVANAEDQYVPKSLYPSGDGASDYIIMEIDENGMIADWNFDISEFTGSAE